LRQRFERALVDIAHVHARAVLEEGLRDRQADAAGAGRDQHA